MVLAVNTNQNFFCAERIVRLCVKRSRQTQEKLLQNLVFCCCKRQKIFSASGAKIKSKIFFASGRKGFSPDLDERNRSVFWSILRNGPNFPHFCVFGWNCFWRTSSKKCCWWQQSFSASGEKDFQHNRKE